MKWLKPRGYNNPTCWAMLWNQWLHQGFRWGWYSYEAYEQRQLEVK